MAFDHRENMSNANARKIEHYCDLGFLIFYEIGSNSSWSNNKIYSKRRVRDTNKNLGRLKRSSIKETIEGSRTTLPDFFGIFTDLFTNLYL